MIHKKRECLERNPYILDEDKTMSLCQLLVKKGMKNGDNDSMQAVSEFLFVGQRVGQNAPKDSRGSRAAPDLPRRFKYVFHDKENSYGTLKKFYRKLCDISKTQDGDSMHDGTAKLKILQKAVIEHLDIGHDLKDRYLCDIIIDQVLKLDSVCQSRILPVFENMIKILDKARETRDKNVQSWDRDRLLYNEGYREKMARKLQHKQLETAEKAAHLYGLIADTSTKKYSRDNSLVGEVYKANSRQYESFQEAALIKEKSGQVSYENRQICVSRLDFIINMTIGNETYNRDPEYITHVRNFITSPKTMDMTTKDERMPFYFRVVDSVPRAGLTLPLLEQMVEVMEASIEDTKTPGDENKFPAPKPLKSLFRFTASHMTKPLEIAPTDYKTAIDSRLSILRNEIKNCQGGINKLDHQQFKDDLVWRVIALRHWNDGFERPYVADHKKGLRHKRGRHPSGPDSDPTQMKPRKPNIYKPRID